MSGCNILYELHGTLSGGFKFLKNALMQHDMNIKVSSSLKLCQIKQSLTVYLIFYICTHILSNCFIYKVKDLLSYQDHSVIFTIMDVVSKHPQLVSKSSKVLSMIIINETNMKHTQHLLVTVFL